MTSKRNPNTSRRVMDFNSIKDYEQFLKSWVQPGIFNFNATKIVERFSDEDGVITEEMLLVEDKNRRAQFMLHIVELKDEQTLKLTLREAQVLKQLDEHEHIMTLFTNFRHRQYVGLLLPAYAPLRDRIDFRLENKDLSGCHGSSLRFGKSLSRVHEKKHKDQLGLFTPNAVVYVLCTVVDALRFMHSKQLVHTQLCATNIFMDGGGEVKIGGFLHSRRTGSKNWTFTGDPNCYPPEAFIQDDPRLSVHPSFDYWSLGLLTLELITGQRKVRKEEQCRRLSEKYTRGASPPTLAEIDPTTLVNGKQSYDPNVESFLARALAVDPQRRADFSLHDHPFLKRNIQEIEARHEWNIPISTGSPFDAERSLFQEMFNSQGSRPNFADDFLTRILSAVRLAEKDFYPVFEEIPDAQLFSNYVGIEASVAIPNDDSEWSRDVLNVSRASSNKDLNEFEQDAPISRAPNRRTGLTGEDFDINSHHPGLEKDYQRHEMCFFVKKNWSDEERQVFVALQFARWYLRGVIKFPDLVRVCDEIEDIIQNYVLTPKRHTGRDPPESIYFASALRRLLLNPAEHGDRETRHLCHMYVDIALSSEMNAQKKKKMLKLSEGDPIDMPNVVSKTLQVAACYKEVDARKFDAIEALLLGQTNVSQWELDESQRNADATGPETKLYKLLYERRRNPNRQVVSNDWTSSAQARTAKLWGDYDRDFLYKACNWAIPHKLDESRARTLYGDPFEESRIRKTDEGEDSLLDMQLSRTRVKQEEDVILPMKRVEDVEARRAALENAEAMLARVKGTPQGGGRRLEDQLKRFEANTNLNNSGL